MGRFTRHHARQRPKIGQTYWIKPTEIRLDSKEELFGNVPRDLLEDIIDECESIHGEQHRLAHAIKRVTEFEKLGRR